MNELLAIVDAHAAFAAEGRRSVLLTLVEVEGSSYRRPGAKMLVDEDGRSAGFIGGGCLEGDLAEHARMVLEGGHPKLISYDLSEIGDLAWGLGVGCPGTIGILLECVGDELAARLGEWSRLEEPIAILTVFDVGGGSRFGPGTRWSVRADGSLDGIHSDDPVADPIRETGLAAIDSRRSRVVEIADGKETVKVLAESLEPPLKLVVFGTGLDAAALIRLALELNWDVTIVDPAAGEDPTRRYPDKANVVQDDPAEAFGALNIDRRTAAVVMSHHFPRDREVLGLLSDSPCPYIGLLGASSRRDLLLSELPGGREEELRDRLYAPVGLDIGGDRPEEIALAILAEIQAFFTGRKGGFLRDRKRPIHNRADDETGAG